MYTFLLFAYAIIVGVAFQESMPNRRDPLQVKLLTFLLSLFWPIALIVGYYIESFQSESWGFQFADGTRRSFNGPEHTVRPRLLLHILRTNNTDGLPRLWWVLNLCVHHKVANFFFPSVKRKLDAKDKENANV